MASGTIKAVVGRSDIVNNLTTNDSTKVLSAAQGKALKDAADTLNSNIENKVSFNEELKTDTSSTSDDSVIALAAFNKAPSNGTAFVMQDTTGAVRHCLVFKRSSQGSVLMLDSYNKTFKCANIINNAVSSVNDMIANVASTEIDAPSDITISNNYSKKQLSIVSILFKAISTNALGSGGWRLIGTIHETGFRPSSSIYTTAFDDTNAKGIECRIDNDGKVYVYVDAQQNVGCKISLVDVTYIV